MSRRIDITRKLTKDERDYLTARGQDHVLAANAEYLRTANATPQDADLNETVSVTVKSLRDEIARRNAERVDADKIAIPAGATKDQLLELVKTDDESTETDETDEDDESTDVEDGEDGDESADEGGSES